MMLHELVIKWQAQAIELYKGRGTKERIAQAEIYEECANELLECIAGDFDPVSTVAPLKFYAGQEPDAPAAFDGEVAP